MVEIIELFIAAVSFAIYGTDERPRHPFWRNAVRTVAFTGAIIFLASLLGWLNIIFPMALTLFWCLCGLIVLCAEYEIGSKNVAYAALGTFAILLITLLTKAGLF
jgi:hypothetical protein